MNQFTKTVFPVPFQDSGGIPETAAARDDSHDWRPNN